MIQDYIQTIKEEGNFGGDFELSIPYDIFKINISHYLLEKDNNDIIMNLSFDKYINGNNNKNKNLLILVNKGGAHFMAA